MLIGGPGFVVAYGFTDKDDTTPDAAGRTFVQSRLHVSEIHPGWAWPPILVHDPSELGPTRAAHPGNKYTYHDLDYFDMHLLSRALLVGLRRVPLVHTSGVLPEQIYLDYSQERVSVVWTAAIESVSVFVRAQHYLARRSAGSGLEEYFD